MDTQSQNTHFEVGSKVIYGLLGKCQITAIEARHVGSEIIHCYKLEIEKSTLSRSARQTPSIWLPIASANTRGLRLPIQTSDEADSVFAILGSPEFYFSIQEAWSTVYPKLENTIRTEGSIGLAKVFGYLTVLKKRQFVASPETSKFLETVSKLLFRELSDRLTITLKSVEERANKALKQKLLSREQ